MRKNKTASAVPYSQGGDLGRELGIQDARLLRVLYAFGLDDTCGPLVSWIPAVELAWVGGLTARERKRLLQLVRARHAAIGASGERLLADWLRRRPPDALFRTAKRALRAQLTGVPPIERPALRARVIGPCVELAHASGGVLGCAAMSADERTWLETFTAELQLPDDPVSTTGGRS